MALSVALAVWALVVWSAGPVQAEERGIALRDLAQLKTALGETSPCCVIDGRSAASRRKDPYADGQPYRKGMLIRTSTAAVVIADRDAVALRIGKALAETARSHDVLPVKGGIKTWRAYVASRLAGAGPITFVIPKNTCESGTAIQTLKYGNPKK